jgi:hypothetical protein
MYVWCPADITSSIPPQLAILRDQKVSVLLKDVRTFGTKVENKCSSEDVINSIYGVLKAAYPNAVFSKATENTPAPNSITISIDILAYHASFSGATWHANTSYAVKIIDNRTGEAKEATKTVERDKSFFNALGIITAKSNLKKCYEDVCMQLIDFISATVKN